MSQPTEQPEDATREHGVKWRHLTVGWPRLQCRWDEIAAPKDNESEDDPLGAATSE